jgi:NADPH:quinone reductase
MWVSSNAGQLDQIGALITEGKVKPVIQAVFPLSQTREAHELSATNRVRGKIVLKVA